VAKKPWETDVQKFMNSEKREEDYFEQHGTYLENKKEQQDRIQLFYVLEQFFEQSRQKKDAEKMSEA